ncbi:MAG: HD domain-containing protein [Thermodesulfobacteriota bacterium]|nr:HD domain-containing protein [Thermodesulfobacteriota bacterium]
MTVNSTDDYQQHLWVKDIKEEDSVRGCYLVKGKKMGTTRRSTPFISLTLADRTGEIEAKVWDRAEEFSSVFREGDVVELEGHAGSYRGQIQITVSGLRPVRGEMDPDIFLESTPMDPSEMMKSLRHSLREVKDAHLRTLNESFLNDREFVSLFKKAPAAKRFHHNYLGGLLEHTLSVCRLTKQVAEHYPQLDCDLLLTGAFLHDIGKIKELACHLKFDYTDEGRLLGHVMLSVTMVEEKITEAKDFPRDLAIRLKHLILSHHGEYEFGSPKRPKFLEAFALHLVDDLDAKINGLGRFMERDRQEGAWTDYNRLFGRYFLKGEILPVEKETDEGIGAVEGQQMLFTTDSDLQSKRRLDSSH